MLNCKLGLTGYLVQSELQCTNGLYDFVNKYTCFEHRYSCSPDEIKILGFSRG